MKRVLIFILSALLVLTSFALGVSANRTLPLVVDNADLLTSGEEASLITLLEGISSSQQIEIAIVTVNSTGGKSVMEYADDFYDDNGYGWGENDDGALLLVDMGAREWWITTYGDGARYLNDYALYQIENAFIDYLSDGNYFAAFSTFASICESYVISGKQYNGNSSSGNSYYPSDDYYYDYDYDYDYSDYEEDVSPLDFILPSIIVGFIISLIMVSIMKAGMKSVRSASGAADYMVRDSLSLRTQSDRYLYSTTVRTRRDTTSSNGSHGGSSMHRGSSGRSHGGRGGRF